MGKRKTFLPTPYSMDHDGNGDYLQVTDAASISTTDELTVQFKGMVRSYTNATNGLISKSDAGGNEWEWYVNQTTGLMRFTVETTAGSKTLFFSYVPPKDTDLDMVIVKEDVNFHLFVDSLLVETQTVAANDAIVDNTADLFIGVRAGDATTLALEGRTDTVRVWTTGLSESEVIKLQQKGVVPQTNFGLELLITEGRDNTVADTSGNSNDATRTNATWSSSVGTPLRRAFQQTRRSLKGTSSGVQMTTGTTVSPGDTDWTLQVVLKVGILDGANRQYYSQNTGTGTGYSWLRTSGADEFASFAGGSTHSSGFVPEHGGWYEVTQVHDNTANTLDWFINGSFIAQNTSVAPNTNNGAHILLATSSPGSHSEGYIATTRIWTDKLTDAEVQNLYHKSIAPRDNLDTEYLMTDTVGATVTDSSGNSNHGTLTEATRSILTPFS